MGLSEFEYEQLKPNIDLAVQSLHILHHFPGFTYQRERGCGVWRGTLQPRSLSSKYRVAISYKPCCYPKVRVVAPELLPSSPHLWKDKTLCLFYPKEQPWRQDMLIAQTILPWTALWLYYYELWLDVGKWLGPSSHTMDQKLQGGNVYSEDIFLD